MGEEEKGGRYRRQQVRGVKRDPGCGGKLLELHESAVGAVDRAAREAGGHPVQYEEA